MKRRAFLKSLALGSGAAVLSSPGSRLYAASPNYDGRLLVVMQLSGGWDVTSLCDPKSNVSGEPEINQWARTGEIQTAGNIHYAPFASNASLFSKYHSDMLVINGVDSQTNSHETGILHSWSGRTAEGFPTMTALFAAQNAPDIPLSYVNFGGFGDTAKLIRYSRLESPDTLRELLLANNTSWDDSTLRGAVDLARIQQAQQERLQRKLALDTLTERQRLNMSSYWSARDSADALERMAAIMPSSGTFQQNVNLGGRLDESSLLAQIQLMMLGFEAGVGCAADLHFFGFDTHANHDEQHISLFNHFADSLDYFWTYAEERGVADRITLVIGSDFGRTPHYNSDNGKDHWPIGSYIVMEKGASWGNRTVGLTDELHNAYRINPATLQRDDSGGTIIYPKHVHQAIRSYMGLDSSPLTSAFPFANAEAFDFFNPAL
jgi:uncharacterized protein (DUF1501 family)